MSLAAHFLGMLQEKIKRIKHLKEGLGVTKHSGPEAASFNELWSDPALMKAVAGKH